MTMEKREPFILGGISEDQVHQAIDTLTEFMTAAKYCENAEKRRHGMMVASLGYMAIRGAFDKYVFPEIKNMVPPPRNSRGQRSEIINPKIAA